MVKQIRDYVLEARLIRESKEQRNEELDSFKVNVQYGKSIKGSLQFRLEGEKYRLFMPSKYDPLYEDFSSLKSVKFSSKEEARNEIKNRLSRLKALNPIVESAQKNEEKEFTIKLVTPFGKAKVCSWKANSVDAAVKEFLDANPAYRENKKGAVIAESISDDIVKEVKEEVKDGVKGFVQQDVDAKLNGEITPKDYQANFEEDVDDDSDSIFGDELDNAEPDEPEQANESVDEKSLKDFLKAEHSMALKKITNMAADDVSSFYKGYATAIHNTQRKFKL